MYFKDIIGQDEIKKRLIHSAQTGVVPHAQLFTEQGGAGAFPLTLAYARYLNCTNRTETDSCGHCPSCLKYNELAHPDLHFVFPIVSKKDKKKDVCDDYLTEWRGFLKDRPYIDGLLDRIQEEEKAATGKTAAYFRLPNAEGKQITRSNFKDQYLLIHFWASWNTVSRDSNAVYRRIYRKGQKNKKFALLGISLDLNKDNWKKAIETDTLKWEQACDLSGWETGVVKQLAIRTLPANVLLSPSGRIEGKNLSEAAIEKKLKDIEEQEKKEKEKKREIENERKKKR